MVSNTKNTMPCPFSGRYRLAGTTQALSALLEHDSLSKEENSLEGDKEDPLCHSVSVFMHAGCSDSSDLMIDSTCHPKPAGKPLFYAGSQSSREAQMQNDQPPQRLRTEYTCHGQWSEASPDHILGGSTTVDSNHVEVVTAAASTSAKKTLMLSSGSRMLRDNSLRRQFICLTYTEQDGVLWASATKDACMGPTVSSATGEAPAMEQLHHTYYPTASSSGIDYLRDSAVMASDDVYFNITSSGPCLQALTGASINLRSGVSLVSLVIGVLSVWVVL